MNGCNRFFPCQTNNTQTCDTPTRRYYFKSHLHPFMRTPPWCCCINWMINICIKTAFFHSFLYKTQTGVIANLTAFLKANVKNITLCYKRLRLCSSRNKPGIYSSNSKRVTVRSTLEGLRWSISIKLLITHWSLCMFESTQKKKKKTQYIHVFIRIYGVCQHLFRFFVYIDFVFCLSAQLEARSLYFLSAHQKHSNCYFYVLTFYIHQSGPQPYHQLCEAALCQNAALSSMLHSENLTQSSVVSGQNVGASWTIKLTLNNTVPQHHMTSTSATHVPVNFLRPYELLLPLEFFPVRNTFFPDYSDTTWTQYKSSVLLTFAD